MTDHIDRYKERVRKWLSHRENGPLVRVTEALCLPSFHPETLLRVIDGPAGTRFRLATLSSSLWFSEESTKEGQPGCLQEVIAVAPDLALNFWTSMEELKPETIHAVEEIGVDGMSVEASYRQGEGEASVSFETWCPDPASPPGKLIHLIYDLAWKVLKEPFSIERLEQLHGYIRVAALTLAQFEGAAGDFLKKIRVEGRLFAFAA